MKSFLLAAAGAVAGFALTFLVIVGVEGFSSVVHPFPAGVEMTNEEICRHVERYPAWILAAVVPMWAAAAFVGTWVARRIGNFYSAAVVSLLTVAALFMNLSMLPYPLWFKAACVVAIPAAAVAGGTWGRRQGTSPSS